MSIKHLARRRPSPAMIVACCALFVALGGTSYALAVGSIGSREIRDNSVGSIDVRNGSLKGSDLQRDSIGAGAIKEETLDVSKLQLPATDPPLATHGTILQAEIQADGGRFNARGIASVGHTSTGSFHIVFDRDVSRCALLTSLTGSAYGGGTGLAPVEVFAHPDLADPEAIYVTTISGDHMIDRDFYLLVSC